MYTIEMLPAYLGDAFWIEYGDAASPSRILIDGGLVGTADAIKAKIDAVSAKEGRCKLELLVISHIDADHIEGIIKLLGEPNLPLEIEDLWFNGRHHLPDPEASTEDEFLGAKQGEFLSALICERGLPWNKAFKGDTVFVPLAHKANLPRKELPGGMELVLLSPTYMELLKLSERWEDALQEAGLLHTTHEEVMEALRNSRTLSPEDEFLGGDEPLGVEELVSLKESFDRSVANGSSIAFVASFAGKRCLFGGDAYSPVLSESAKRLAKEENRERVSLDAFKIPHHGSKSNIHDDLLERLDCRRFLISTDGGRFKHPDRQAIARLVGGRWRPQPQLDKGVELHFNYRSESNEEWNDEELWGRWNYKTSYPERKKSTNNSDRGQRVILKA